MLLLAVIYLTFISLGLPDSLLGSAWPVMHETLGVSLSYAGCVSMIVSGGTIVSSLLSDRLTRRFGTKYVTLVSVALTAVALLGYSFSNQFWMVCLWAIPYGLGAGAIDSALNNYVALHYASRHMNWLHAFWGVGTIISPYIMSWALSNSSWPVGYRVVAAIQLSITLILAFSMPLWKSRPAEETPAGEAVKPLGIVGALRIHGVIWLLVGFFAYCAFEGITMLWTSSYLVSVRGMAAEPAAAYASLFFIGITLGRILAGFISEKLGDRTMIRLGTLIALCGVIAVLLPVSSNVFALVGLVIFGLGCGPIYPAVIHSTPDNFGAHNSQAIIGIQMASAYVGSAFMPPLFGAIAGRTSLSIMPFVLLGFLLLMIVMLENAYTRARKNSL